MKRAVALIALVGVLAGLPACGKREQFRDEVLRAVDRTEVLPGLLKYIDQREDGTVSVQGIFDDDFRYKARVIYGSQPAYEQVVVDDTLAVRLIDPSALNRITDPSKLAGADTETEFEGVTVPMALQSNRWVVDGGAAPYLSVGEIDESKLGSDPVFDALTALDYVEAAVGKSIDANLYDKDDLSPAYNRSEDPFPAPADGSGVTRYDLIRPDLPPPSAGSLSGQAESALPRTEHFRKMAIYIRDGKVFQVREAIDIRGKQVDDVAKYIRLFMEESKTPKQIRDQFDEGFASTPEDERGSLLIFILNQILQSLGEPPILQRVMNLEFPFDALGEPVSVALPADGVVKGNLDFLNLSAKSKGPEAAAPAGPAAADPGGTAPAGEPGSGSFDDTPQQAPAGELVPPAPSG